MVRPEDMNDTNSQSVEGIRSHVAVVHADGYGVENDGQDIESRCHEDRVIWFPRVEWPEDGEQEQSVVDAVRVWKPHILGRPVFTTWGH